MIRRLIFLLLLSVFPMTASATTWYLSNSTANGWVVGNNTNNCTATSTPCLTFDGVTAKVLVTGDTIIVNDGTVNGPFNSLTKGVTVQALNAGLATIKSTGAAFAMKLDITDGSTVTFSGLIFDSNAQNYGIYDTVEALHGLTVTNCTIQNYFSDGIHQSATGDNLTLNVSNSTFTAAASSGAGAIKLEQLLSGSVNVSNTQFNLTLNAPTNTVSPWAVSVWGASGVTSVTITNVKAEVTAGTSSSRGAFDVRNVASVTMDGVYVHTVNATSLVGGQDGIHISVCGSGLTCTFTTVPVTTCSIKNAFIFNEATAGPVHGVIVGEDISSTSSTAYHQINSCTIDSSTAIGPAGNTVQYHAFVIGDQNGGKMTNLTADNVAICFLLKGTNNAQIAGTNYCSRAGWAGVFLKAASNNLVSGVSVTYIAGQACNNAGGSTCYGILVAIDGTTSITSTGNKIVNTKYYAYGGIPTGYNYVDSTGTGSTATFSGGEYFIPAGTANFTYQTNNYSTVSAWQSARETNLFYQPQASTTGSVF